MLATQASERSRLHRMRPWESPSALTRCQALTISTVRPQWWKSRNTRTYSLRSTWLNVWTPIMSTTMAPPLRLMMQTLHTRHHSTLLPLLAGIKKETLKAVHTAAVNNAVASQEDNKSTTQSTTWYQQWRDNTEEETTDHSITVTLQALQTPELLQEPAGANCQLELSRLW